MSGRFYGSAPAAVNDVRTTRPDHRAPPGTWSTSHPSDSKLLGSFDGAPAPGRAGIDEVPFDELVASGRDVEPDVPVSDDDVLGLAFTSGTTGLPKGVLQPQRMVKSLVVAG